MVSLLELKINENAIIKKIDIDNNKRLLGLGFVNGISILKKFESFDKKMYAFEINGSVICIRKNVCKNIFVEVGD